MGSHSPVLYEQVIEALAIQPDGVYLDGTYGRGGHSAGILARLGPRGRLFAFDRDTDAIAAGKDRFGSDQRIRFFHASFAELENTLAAELGERGLSGVLLDLGVSSPQLDEPARGFSFQKDGPLDMRLDRSAGVSAADWLAAVEEKELTKVLKRFGEEPNAKRIAAAIVHERTQAPIRSTARLAEVVASAAGRGKPGRHPATRTFQAIRIFINDELDALRAGLEQALTRLAAGGRLVVISFHSLEDRIVKRFMRENAMEDPVYRGLPDVPPQARAKLRLIGKAIRPSETEVQGNPRSRSATLRVAERLASA